MRKLLQTDMKRGGGHSWSSGSWRCTLWALRRQPRWNPRGGVWADPQQTAAAEQQNCTATHVWVIIPVSKLQCCGFEIFIPYSRSQSFCPGSEFFHSWSASKNLKIFLTRKTVSKLSKIWSRIQILIFFTHPGSRDQKGTGTRDPDPQHCQVPNTRGVPNSNKPLLYLNQWCGSGSGRIWNFLARVDRVEKNVINQMGQNTFISTRNLST